VAAGAGIHVNKSERLVAHDFQDVGMAADKEARPQPTYFLPGPTVVIAWIPADVRHVDVEALALPNEILGQIGAEFRPVNVPVNSPDRLEGPETIQHFGCPEVSRVPHLVAFGEMLEDSVIEKTMGVGKQPDSQSQSYKQAGCLPALTWQISASKSPYTKGASESRPGRPPLSRIIVAEPPQAPVERPTVARQFRAFDPFAVETA
jgi:hypothetical protein